MARAYDRRPSRPKEERLEDLLHEAVDAIGERPAATL